jgi:hypothetical protein
MSHLPLSLSPDLSKLVNEGYNLEIVDGHLLLKDVPYVNSKKEVKRGMIVDVLKLNADVALPPDDHTIWFGGEQPCDAAGALLPVHSNSKEHEIAVGVTVNWYFSRKPVEPDKNFYDKMLRYLAFISRHAAPANARTFPVYENKEKDAIFRYVDTASSRAGIAKITAKLQMSKVAIVGLGGTGSYVLDFLAKTPVRDIYLFDGDLFLQHNAFRSPGAPSIEDLKKHATKAEFFQEKYSNMHLNIHAGSFVTEANVNELKQMNFVFICIDRPSAKKIIVERLGQFGIPFVDVGMGIYTAEESLAGTLRVTTSTNEKREHVYEKNRIGFTDMEGNNEYSQNIQIADLNALNAALAVVKWKKLFGFYRDFKNEHFATYHIFDNRIVNEDQV